MSTIREQNPEAAQLLVGMLAEMLLAGSGGQQAAASVAQAAASVPVEAQQAAAIGYSAAVLADYDAYCSHVTNGQPKPLDAWAAKRGVLPVVPTPQAATSDKRSNAETASGMDVKRRGGKRDEPIAVGQTVTGQPVKCWRRVNRRGEDRGSVTFPGEAMPHVLASLKASGIIAS